MPVQTIVEGGWRNRLSLPVMARLGIPVMHTWNLSVPLWEYHHGFQVPLGPLLLHCPKGPRPLPAAIQAMRICTRPC